MMRMRFIRPATGFTLMETLVMLMLVSLAAALMFQMLDGYRVAQQRVAARAAGIDRASLLDAWIADSIGGLVANSTQPFEGSEHEFRGTTLNPLLGSPGAPSDLRWQLDADGIVYSESGQERWVLPVRDMDTARFVYLDADGEVHRQWPPARGVQAPLPAAIAFVRGEGDAERVRVAAVRGPLVPVEIPFQLELE